MEKTRSDRNCLLALRARDAYPSQELQRELEEKIFPRTPEEAVRRLSNVTGAFYGYTLKQAGLHYGWETIDTLSRELFSDLGSAKSREARDAGIDLPADSRALAIVIITAIFTSSPEYIFSTVTYTPQETAFRLKGACRYYRIARSLNIEGHLTWPVLVPFFQSVAHENGFSSTIETAIDRLDDDGTCDLYFRCTMTGQ
jgi:hypothetical protein